MSQFILPPPPQPSVAVSGRAERFAVRRIFCVGRNYAEHAREFGNDPDREPPFFFSKPADALVDDGASIPFAQSTKNLHFEAELVVAIGMGGRDIAPGNALDHVWGYGAGNDLTRRDLQAQAKDMRRPWDMAKGFDWSAVCGPLFAASKVGHPASAKITCTVNGVTRQDADISDMIWPVPDVIAHLSALVTLAPGDLIFTGTPAGVGALVSGDVCEVMIEGLGRARVTLL